MMSYNEYAGYRETIESLRQQLASRDAEITELREQIKLLQKDHLKYRWLLNNAVIADGDGYIALHYQTSRMFSTHGDAESIKNWLDGDIHNET